MNKIIRHFKISNILNKNSKYDLLFIEIFKKEFKFKYSKDRCSYKLYLFNDRKWHITFNIGYKNYKDVIYNINNNIVTDIEEVYVNYYEICKIFYDKYNINELEMTQILKKLFLKYFNINSNEISFIVNMNHGSYNYKEIDFNNKLFTKII